MISATRDMRGENRVFDRLNAVVSHDGASHESGARRGPGTSPVSEQNLIECVEADLASNFGDPITLRDIEKSSGYSVYQIIRTFRRHLGITPHAYLIRMRTHYAAMRLMKGDTLAAAAAEAGFADQSHMTRHFKRVFGTTPRRYILDGRCEPDSARREVA